MFSRGIIANNSFSEPLAPRTNYLVTMHSKQDIIHYTGASKSDRNLEKLFGAQLLNLTNSNEKYQNDVTKIYCQIKLPKWQTINDRFVAGLMWFPSFF